MTTKRNEAIAVIGLGNWGTAIAQHLARQGNNVLGWTREADVAAQINQKHRHPRIFTDFQLDDNLTATTDLKEACRREILVYALPSSTLDQVVPRLSLESGAILVSAVKGFERASSLTPLQFFSKQFASTVQTAVISGPSFANDLMREHLCGLVCASSNLAVSRRLAEVFSGASIRVYTSSDPIGVELGGAVKNVIALAAGISDGLGLGESARAGLITRGLAEIMRLAESVGADRFTLTGLSGLGDLIMTATSTQSRNYSAGYRLGKGDSVDHVRASTPSVIESFDTTPIVCGIAHQRKIEMPISEKMLQILRGEVSVGEGAKQLMQRPLKGE